MILKKLGEKIFLYFSLFFLLSTNYLMADTKIIYPKPIHDNLITNPYTIELLQLVLEHSGEDYFLEETKIKMLQGRALSSLKHGKNIDILWTMTSKEREKDLRAVRVPLYKGLIGYRLLLINKKDIKTFKKIDKIDELSKFRAGQGHDWPDTKILLQNGFNTVKGSNYEGLFKMLQANRFDYFPRSIIEIWDEYETYKKENIVIEDSLLIQYPTASYFFVNKKNIKLAIDLENGLKKIQENGLYDKLFFKYYNKFIEKSNLKNRKIFKIDNLLLSEETPLNKKELWFNPYKL